MTCARNAGAVGIIDLVSETDHSCSDDEPPAAFTLTPSVNSKRKRDPKNAESGTKKARTATQCQNSAKCNRAKCQRKSHEACPSVQCNERATNGPGNERMYCSVCTHQLKLMGTHQYNGKRCVECGDGGGKKPVKYGVRAPPGQKAATPTHCSACAKSFGLVNVSVRLCSFKLTNGSWCPKQARKQAHGSTFCSEHVKGFNDVAAGDAVSLVSKCRENGCTNQVHTKGYCRTHGAKRDIRTSMCADCGIKRYSWKANGISLCGTCLDHRMDCGDLDEKDEIISTQTKCRECKEKRPSFALCLDDPPRYCGDCKPDGYICVTNKNAPFKVLRVPVSEEEKKARMKKFSKCRNAVCSRSRAYGYKSDRRPLVCVDHLGELEEREDDLVIMAQNLCKSRECLNIVKRKLPDGARVCEDCAGDEGESLPKPMCVEDSCNKIAIRGVRDRVSGTVPSTYCAQHASPEMAKAQSMLCKYQDDQGLFQCNVRASRGVETTQLYCTMHAGEDHGDLVHKMCESCGIVRATFGYQTHGGPISCVKCKNEDGDDDMVDLLSAKCVFNGCMLQPSYGFKGMKASRCSLHKLIRMVDVKSKLCEDYGCSVVASFGIKKPTHCFQHKAYRMTNLRLTMCDLCKMMAVSVRYKPNCTQCHFYLHPEDPGSRNYKTKEQAFTVRLKEYHPTISLDKRVAGGCSKRRPDGLIECLTHAVIVEIDEDQHNGYDEMCENRRMAELFQDVAFRPTVFVRLNPDKYKRNGKMIKSAFLFDHGKLKCDKPEFERRFAKLKSTVDNAVRNLPDKSITVIELFYTSP